MQPFGRRDPVRVTRDDPDFGPVVWVPAVQGASGHWSMTGTWSVPWQPEPLTCTAIPGDEVNGPSAEAREFLLQRRDDPESLWAVAGDELTATIRGWSSLARAESREAMFVSSLALDGHGWEVGFETRRPHLWVDVCLQLVGDEIVSATVST